MSLPEGMPKIIPTMAVMSPEKGIDIHKGRPTVVARMAPAYAPTPKKAPCPSEIWPVNPMRMFRPKAAMAAIPVMLMT